MLRKTEEIWCRRGDSNPHELPHTALNRARLPVPPLRLELSDINANANCPPAISEIYFFGLALAAAGEVAGALEGAVTGAVAGAVTGTTLAAGDGAGVGVASGAVDCKTECEPVTPGNESISAKSMKPAAAPIVIFDKMLAVPRGPNAVLETLLEKRSPAPDLPGCKSTTITNTAQDRMNNPYRV